MSRYPIAVAIALLAGCEQPDESVAEPTQSWGTDPEEQTSADVYPEQVVYLDRIVVLDDSCEQGPYSQIDLEFVFTAEQGGVPTELIDTRGDDPVQIDVDVATDDGRYPDTYTFDRASVAPVQFAYADGTIDPVFIVGDAWRRDSDPEDADYRKFSPINDQENTWILTYNEDDPNGEQCHRRYRSVPGVGTCEIQLYLCVVDGNEQSYDPAGCVNPDPDACL